MNKIEGFCDVTLVSEDDERILAHKVVLASSSKIFRDMLRTYEKDKGHPVISMQGVQTEPILQEGESKGYAFYGILKFRHIKCRYFYKGKWCKRRDSCWFSHIETVCQYWLKGKWRYSKNFCKSGHNKEE